MTKHSLYKWLSNLNFDIIQVITTIFQINLLKTELFNLEGQTMLFLSKIIGNLSGRVPSHANFSNSYRNISHLAIHDEDVGSMIER